MAAFPLHKVTKWPWREGSTPFPDLQVKLQGAEVFVEGSGRARVVSVPLLSHAPLAVGGTEAPPSVMGDADASAARCVIGITLSLHNHWLLEACLHAKLSFVGLCCAP